MLLLLLCKLLLKLCHVLIGLFKLPLQLLAISVLQHFPHPHPHANLLELFLMGLLVLPVNLQDHRHNQVDQDQHHDDPERDEKDANTGYAALDLHDVVNDHEPVVHNHLLEQNHDRGREIVKVHLVV